MGKRRQTLDVQVDPHELSALEQEFRVSRRQLDRIVISAINDTGRKTVSGVVKDIAEKIAVTQKELRQVVSFLPARAGNPVGRITVKETDRIPLFEFSARQNRRGVSYRIERGAPRKTAQSAFIATMKSGHEGVFKRTGPTRLPIEELEGPSAWAVFLRAKLRRRTVEDAKQTLTERIRERLKFEGLVQRGQIAATGRRISILGRGG